MEGSTPIDQVLALFNVSALETFFVAAAATLIGLTLVRKGIVVARSMINKS